MDSQPDEPRAIPFDGKPHPCPACGEGEYEAWDGDGWMPVRVVVDRDRVDVDCSGIVDECSRCGVELVAG